MSKTNKIWVDLTHLLQWQGRFTGIERLEYQLVRRFAAKNNAHFFAYNEAARGYFEMPKDTIDQFASGQGGAAVSAGTLGLAARILPHAKKLVPQKLRTLAKSRLIKNQVVEHPFKKGDTVFIAATFSSLLFLENLVTVKKTVGFSLTYLVHDIVPIVRPNYVGDWDTEHFLAYYQQLLPNVDKVLAVSQSTKKDLEAFCTNKKIKIPHIVVVREGDDFKKVDSPQRPSELGAIKRFILCVGTFEVRKNHTLLYYAYKQAAREGVDLPPVIIVGRDGWLTDDIRRIIAKDPEVKDKILHFNNVEDAGLAWLLENCLFTIQPSFYEGWGLPLAESLFYGKLCLASDAASLPEVGGEFADYFSPFDSRDCMQKIALYANNPKQLQQREQFINKNYKPTTWDDTFAQVISAL